MLHEPRLIRWWKNHRVFADPVLYRFSFWFVQREVNSPRVKFVGVSRPSFFHRDIFSGFSKTVHNLDIIYCISQARVLFLRKELSDFVWGQNSLNLWSPSTACNFAEQSLSIYDFFNSKIQRLWETFTCDFAKLAGFGPSNSKFQQTEDFSKFCMFEQYYFGPWCDQPWVFWEQKKQQWRKSDWSKIYLLSYRASKAATTLPFSFCGMTVISEF